MADIGTSYLQIVPSMQGAVKSIQSTLSGIDLGGASKKMGASLSAALPSSLSKSVSQAMDNAATAAKKPLEAALKGVTSAEADLAKAQNARQKVVDQISKSEQKLSDLQAQGKEGTKAYAQAQARLADQQNKLALSSFDVASAQIGLEAAQKHVATVSSEVDAAIAKQQSGWGKLAIQAPVVADAFKATGNALQTVGGRLTDVGGKLTKSITVPAVGAATAVGGLVAGLGFKRLVGIDTARAQFKGLGYDANAVMKQVDAGVTNTSLSMAEGASAAVSILATGAVPLEGLEAQIKRVANVSAAYGVDASHANYLLNNVLTKQKVTWGDLSQMQQNQIPIVTALADTFGYTGEQIQEMASNGEISIDMLNQALDSKAGAAAEEYAKSWQGVTKNILSNLGKLGAAFMEPSFEIVKDKAADFLAYLKTPEFSTAAASIGQQIAAGLTKAIDVIQRLIGWWNNLSPAVQKTVGTFAAVAVAAGPVLTILGKLLSPIGMLITGIGSVVAVIGGMATAFSGAALATTASTAATIGYKAAQVAMTVASKAAAAAQWLFNAALTANPIMLVVAALAALVAGLAYFFTQTEAGQRAWQAFTDFLGRAWQWICDLGRVVWQGLADFFTGLWESISTGVSTAWAAIGDFLSSIWEGIRAAAEAVWSAISTAIGAYVEAVKTVITTVMDTVKTVWSGAWENIKTVATAVWDVIKTIVTTAINVVKGIVTAVTAAIKGDWAGAWNAIKGIFQTVWNGIKSIASTILNAIKAVISNSVNTIKSVWSAAWNAVKSAFTSVWNGIKSGATAGVNAVYNTVVGIKGRITGFFSGAGSWLINAGRSIIQGLVTGITNMIGAVTNAVGNVMSAARRLLPFSPAKEGPFSGKGWTLYSGQSIVEALAQGVTQKSSLFEGAVEDLMAGGSAALGSGSLGSAYVRGLPAGVGGAAASAGGTTIYDNSTIINPVAEPTSTSKRKQLQKVGAGVNGLG